MGYWRAGNHEWWGAVGGWAFPKVQLEIETDCTKSQGQDQEEDDEEARRGGEEGL